MLEGKGLIEDTDMPLKMQIQAMDFASQALDLYDVVDCKSIAAHIKKVGHFFFFLFAKLKLLVPEILNMPRIWLTVLGQTFGLSSCEFASRVCHFGAQVRLKALSLSDM